MLDAMGIETGIDLAALIEVRKKLAADMPGSPIYGFVADAGVPLDFSQLVKPDPATGTYA
jgi:hydroxymethylglutaryl-CoA lyase